MKRQGPDFVRIGRAIRYRKRRFGRVNENLATGVVWQKYGQILACNRGGK